MRNTWFLRKDITQEQVILSGNVYRDGHYWDGPFTVEVHHPFNRKGSVLHALYLSSRCALLMDTVTAIYKGVWWPQLSLNHTDPFDEPSKEMWNQLLEEVGEIPGKLSAPHSLQTRDTESGRFAVQTMCSGTLPPSRWRPFPGSGKEPEGVCFNRAPTRGRDSCHRGRFRTYLSWFDLNSTHCQPWAESICLGETYQRTWLHLREHT